MGDRLRENLEALRAFVQQNGWEITEEREIQSGLCVDIFDGTSLANVNLYETGSVVVQGKPSILQIELRSWSQSINVRNQSRPPKRSDPQHEPHRFRVSAVDQGDVQEDLINQFHASIEHHPESNISYRLRIREADSEVTIHQYTSGTLMAQGAPSALLNRVVSFLNNHPKVKPFKKDYLQQADQFLAQHLGNEILACLSEGDREGIRSAAALYFAVEQEEIRLSDYSPLVMPFFRAFEGFVRYIIDKESINCSTDNLSEYIKKLDEKYNNNRHIKAVLTTAKGRVFSRNRFFHPNSPTESILRELPSAKLEIESVLHSIRELHNAFFRGGSNP